MNPFPNVMGVHGLKVNDLTLSLKPITNRMRIAKDPETFENKTAVSLNRVSQRTFKVLGRYKNMITAKTNFGRRIGNIDDFKKRIGISK